MPMETCKKGGRMSYEKRVKTKYGAKVTTCPAAYIGKANFYLSRIGGVAGFRKWMKENHPKVDADKMIEKLRYYCRHNAAEYAIAYACDPMRASVDPLRCLHYMRDAMRIMEDD